MSVVDEVKERLDIVEVIAQYVPLKKAGRSYKGLCPFHSEKTPSFVVFPENQSWHCFGACSTGGDVFSFVMKRENLDFGEALAILAARAGVELQPRTTAATADEQRIERLRQIVAEAAAYYNYLLNRAAEAGIARETLERRGLSRQTWESWQLGYSLDSWDALKDRLTGKGYTLAEIDAAGLIIQRDDGSGYYDRFRGRLMIPIRDAQSRTIGFGARVLREEPGRPQPKYINSPQTPLFDKSSVLYGLDMAKKAIRDADLAVIVEGYMDVLMSHQVGVANVVAGMGTALTEPQMRQLKRYSNNLTLALDPDAAGDHAAIRGLEAARQAMEREWQPVVSPTGLVRQESRLKAQLRIAALPDGLDPDELAFADVERWRQVIAAAAPIVDYFLALVGREENLSTARGKANAVERMAPIIREIANPVERGHYVQQLARLIQADERLVAEQIAQLRPADERRPFVAATRPRPNAGAEAGQGEETPPEQAGQEPRGPAAKRTSTVRHPSSAVSPEAHLLGCLLARPDLWVALDAQLIELSVPPLSPEDLDDAGNRAVLATLQNHLPAAAEWEPGDLLGVMPPALAGYCRRLLEQAQRRPSLTDDRLLKDLVDLVLRLRQDGLYRQVSQIRYLIQELEESSSLDEARRYRELMPGFTGQIAQVQKLLNARTMAGALSRANRNAPAASTAQPS
jgi:DNA primase